MPDHGPLQLSTWQASQLRVALRDAFLSFEQLAGPDEIRRTKSAAPPPTHPPSVRERVPVQIPARPSVAELRLRHSQSTG